MNNIEISFIVPCFNSYKTIILCVDSILNQLNFNNVEIIIINDGSTDQTEKVISKYANHDPVVIINHPTNMGLSSARNTGISHARGKMCAFIDSDMELKKNWLLESKTYMKNKNIIGVMGNYKFPSNIKKNSLDIYLYSSLRGAKKVSNGGIIQYKYFLFSNTVVQKHALTKLGGFDDRFICYGGEDTDLSIRLSKLYPKGLHYCPNMTSYHHGQKNLNRYCDDQKLYGKNNLPILIKKHPQLINDLAGKWLTSFRGYIIFNGYIVSFVNQVLKYYNNKYLIKYKIVYSIISGYRLSLRK